MINCIWSLLIFYNIKLSNIKSKLKNKKKYLCKKHHEINSLCEMEIIYNEKTICIGATPEQTDPVCVYRCDMHVEEADVLL